MLTFSIRVSPGASRAGVGGSYGDALRVRVNAPAVDGRANEAVITALAEAFAVRSSAVTIKSGATGRSKVVTIDADADALSVRLAQLLQS